MVVGLLKPYVPLAKGVVDDVVGFFPTGLILCVAAGCVEHKKYWSAFVKEFVGTLEMIVFTFSAGKWIGASDITIAWTWHACGVVLADYLGTFCDGMESKRKESTDRSIHEMDFRDEKDTSIK